METLLERCVQAGMTASPNAVQAAREYAMRQYFAPSADELQQVADAIGIQSRLLCGIVYAQLAVKENEEIAV
jgi:hypothetical protein